MRNLSSTSKSMIKYLKSARRSDTIAQYKLGYCYQYCLRVTKIIRKHLSSILKSSGGFHEYCTTLKA